MNRVTGRNIWFRGFKAMFSSYYFLKKSISKHTSHYFYTEIWAWACSQDLLFFTKSEAGVHMNSVFRQYNSVLDVFHWYSGHRYKIFHWYPATKKSLFRNLHLAKKQETIRLPPGATRVDRNLHVDIEITKQMIKNDLLTRSFMPAVMMMERMRKCRN